MFLFAEKRLDNFIVSQHISDMDTTASCYGDRKRTMNCSDIDTSMARSLPDHTECSNIGSVFSLSNCSRGNVSYSSLNESELKTESDFNVTNNSSPDETEFVEGQEKCSTDFPRNVDICRVTDSRVDTDIAVSERDTVEVDTNCNELVPSGCKRDWNVGHDEESFHSEASDNQTSTSVSFHTCEDDGTQHSGATSQGTSVVMDTVHATSAVVMV